MTDKKNIERLFQEKFKDFEATPAPEAWKNIAARLEEKEKKRRVFPFWFNAKVSGIAAALVIGFWGLNKYSSETNWNSSLDNNQNETVVLQENDKSSKDESTLSTSTKKEIENISTKSENSIATVNNSEINSDKNYTSQNSIEKSKNNTSYQSTKNISNYTKNNKSSSASKNIKPSVKYFNNSNELFVSNGTQKSREKNNSESNSNTSTPINQLEEILEKNSSNTNKPNQNIVSQEKEKLVSIDENKSIIDAKENKVISIVSIPTNTTIDSSKTSKLEENPLEKLLKEKELAKIADAKKEPKKKDDSNWKLKPTVAPIFMFAKNGSPIDSKFIDNQKTYNNTLSIGIGIEKKLSERFEFRTSINNLDLSYNTNEIAFFSTLEVGNPASKGMQNITINQSALLTAIVDNKDTKFDNEIGFQNKKEGYLNQKINYVEIPLEISYKFLDKKVGLQLVTGLSTLFLNKNQVSLVSNNSSFDLGEANNLNVVHFSTNIGLGLKYNFWKSFEASVEPTFKYQLFTFHTNAGGFKPYIIGLYSGVSYKF